MEYSVFTSNPRNDEVFSYQTPDMKKIYIAGPGIFRPDAVEYGAGLKAVCRRYGFEGLFPLDTEVQGLSPRDNADKIRASNIAMIEQCNYLIADLSPFRGPEPDSGTAWEVGYATALGKPVVGYSMDQRLHVQKTVDILGLEADATTDREGRRIEDFSLTHNLMFANVLRHASFEECLADIRARERGTPR